MSCAAYGPYGKPDKGKGKVVAVNVKGKGKVIQVSKGNGSWSSSPNGSWDTDCWAGWFSCSNGDDGLVAVDSLTNGRRGQLDQWLLRR